MKVDVLGCGSAFSKRNNTSAILVIDEQNHQCLIDCGPTIPRAIWQRNIDINAIQAIYFTHIHPDHCSGLAALLNQWKSFNRSASLTIFCQTEQREPLQQLVQLATWPETSICFDIVWETIEDEFHWHNWQFKTAFTQHEISNRAVRISVDDAVLFYSGDGRPTEASRTLMQGADLAFQECASYKALDEDSSHGDFPNCVELIKTAGVARLGLYHCYDEAIESMQQNLYQYPEVFVSHDNLVIDLAKQSQLSLL